MRLNLSVFNHGINSRETLRDMLDPMIGALRANGHEAERQGALAANCVNVLSECFTLDQADALLASGHRFGLFCTEWFDGERLLGQSDERTAAFFRVAPKAQFIWSVIDQPRYRDFGIPYAVTEICWEPSCYRRQDTKPVRDLTVYGPMTEARLAIKRSLDDRMIDYKWVSFGAAKEARDAIIGQSRFVLGLPATGKEGEPSPSRICSALHADRGVLPLEKLNHLNHLREGWDIYRERCVMAFSAGKQMRTVMRHAMEIVGG